LSPSGGVDAVGKSLVTGKELYWNSWLIELVVKLKGVSLQDISLDTPTSTTDL